MSNTPNRSVPYVEEGVTDLAAPFNEALRQIDAKFVPIVLEVGTEELPASAADGEIYVLSTGISNYPGYVAQFVGAGGFWNYYAPEQIGMVLNRADGRLYVWDYGTPGTWGLALAASASVIVTDTSEARAISLADAGKYVRYTGAAPIVSFDEAVGFSEGEEYHGRYQGAGVLSLEGTSNFVINTPFGGSLDIPPGGTFTVKIVSPNEADLIGLTVAGT